MPSIYSLLTLLSVTLMQLSYYYAVIRVLPIILLLPTIFGSFSLKRTLESSFCQFPLIWKGIVALPGLECFGVGENIPQSSLACQMSSHHLVIHFYVERCKGHCGLCKAKEDEKTTVVRWSAVCVYVWLVEFFNALLSLVSLSSVMPF